MGPLPPPPAPVIVDGKEKYSVEEILNSQLKGCRLQYYVKWEGYGAGDNSWEPATEMMKHAKEKVKQFHRKHPNAAKKISASIFASLPWQPLSNDTEAPSPVVF